MRKPAMILFDYAHTLAWEPQPDFLRGERAVFAHVKDNPRQVTPEEAARLGTELFLSARDCRHSGWEPHEHQYLRLKYDLLGLTFTLPLNELEKLLWTAACPGELMPGTAGMLAQLRARGIRTGVISNLGWSGEALADRLQRLLPAHPFEFVIASSDYGVRKPAPGGSMVLRRPDRSGRPRRAGRRHLPSLVRRNIHPQRLRPKERWADHPRRASAHPPLARAH